MLKVLVAIPCMDKMHSRFVQSLMMLKTSNNVDMDTKFCIDTLVYTARDDLVRIAIKDKCDYVLFLDSDMTFEPDTLIRLLSHKDDIVSALYFQRKPNYDPVAFDIVQDNGKTVKRIETIDESYREVDAVGMGCCLIKTRVFIDCIQYTGACFNPTEHSGEDISFCMRARHCGYKIMLDQSIRCGHIGTYIYTEKDYEERRGII